jgi:UDP-2,3-diacylglucosamine pyrophosphatase LpxH
LLPKWVKPDFFQTFIDYLTLEDEGKITEALALFMNLTLDSAQRLLWLGDFFQILDIQRFLILEVILPKMTP